MTVIAIDGPAGSGKSTLARLLAARLGFAYLDTGAMYRAVAYLALRDGVATDDGASLAALAREARISFAADGRIVAAERDVSEEIRRPAVSAAVSEVSAHAEVRSVLLDEQRRIGADAGRRDRGSRHRHRRVPRGAGEALPDSLARESAPSGAARS